MFLYLILAVVFSLLLLVSLVSGSIHFTGGTELQKEDNPTKYWFFIILYLFLILGAFGRFFEKYKNKDVEGDKDNE